MSGGRAGRDSGFALVEAIAVLALSGLVLLTLLIAADLVTRNSGRAERRANDLESLATGLAALRRDLSGARHVRSGGPGSPLIFHGGAGSVGIVGADVADDDVRSEKMVWITAQYDGGRGALVRTSAELLPGYSGFASAQFADPVAVLSGPWIYRFAYAATNAGAVQWSGGWANAQAMPAAIRVEVFDAAGTRRVLPPLVVPLRVDAEFGCASAEDAECGVPEDPAEELDEMGLGGADGANGGQ